MHRCNADGDFDLRSSLGAQRAPARELSGGGHFAPMPQQVLEQVQGCGRCDVLAQAQRRRNDAKRHLPDALSQGVGERGGIQEAERSAGFLPGAPMCAAASGEIDMPLRRCGRKSCNADLV